jgi:hypothetical protein
MKLPIRFVRFSHISGIIVLVVVACGGPDSSLRAVVVGTWRNPQVAGMIEFQANGNLASVSSNRFGVWKYEGRWSVENNDLVLVATSYNSHPVHFVERYQVVRATGSELEYEDKSTGQRVALIRNR